MIRTQIKEINMQQLKEYILATIPEFQVVGIQEKIKYHDPNESNRIGKAWQKFFEQKTLEKIPHQFQPLRIIGLYTDYDKEGNCNLIIGAQVTQYNSTFTPEFVHRKIPAQHYAMFSGKGDPSQVVPELWQKIWQAKELQRTFLHDFELYESKQESTIEIYVAIK